MSARAAPVAQPSVFEITPVEFYATAARDWRVWLNWGVRPAAAPRAAGAAFDRVWRWKALRADRHGQPCRINAVGKLNSAEIEFPDGECIITSRYAVRRG